MIISTLYSAIINKPWFIDLREIDGQAIMINKFINHDAADYNAELYSDKHPLQSIIYARDGNSNKVDSFSECDEDTIAVISLSGTMLKDGTMCNYGTNEIAKMIDDATSCENICGIVLNIDSGGGAVDAISPLADAIKRAQATGKPVIASCDLCASAAYFTAVYCDKIIAQNNISSEFGSIGVMTQIVDYAKYYETNGVKIHTIYSDMSNYKNAAYEAAKAGNYDQIKSESLNPLAQKFQAIVQDNRKNLKANVEGILNGKMFYAEDALKNGLIDDIGNLDYAISTCRKTCDSNTIKNFIG